MDEERHKEDLANAGWEPDGTLSEHLAVGQAGDICVIVPARVWGIIGSPVFELYDVQKNLSFCVREIPTPQEAAELLRKHGGPPEEERGNSNQNLDSE